ncbi:transporter substrate-binding domain-containing protein [Thalassiella azotivora]
MVGRAGTGGAAGRALSLVLCVLLASGCSLTVPTDPEGTLDRVRGGVLRVGVSPNPPWTELPTGADDPRPLGREVELVEGFAEELDAEVRWTAGGEEDLFDQLERGHLDVVVGGLTSRSPWSSHAALTVPYVEVPGRDGKPQGHVVAVRMGENAFLVRLERYLLEQEVRP